MLQSDVQKYDYVNALRGLAVLGVILVHSSQSVPPSSQILLWFMNLGQSGVQLFFVASALTLCLSWAARSAHEKSPVRNFYIRRFFRIAPMFYLGIVAYLFINGFSPSYWAPNGIEWWFFPVTAAFLHGFHPETITSVVPGGWSIAVEMSFYLILPLLLRYIKSLTSCFVFFIVCFGLSSLNLVVIPLVYHYPEGQRYLLNSFAFFNFFAQLPVFIIGIYGYFILRNNYHKNLTLIFCGPVFILLFLALIFPAFGMQSNFITDKLLLIPPHFIAAGAFTAFALLLAKWPLRLLVNRMTTTFGKLSFSMYLTHFAIFKLFAWLGFGAIFRHTNLESLLHFMCVVLVTAAVSAVFYQWIEKPGIALGKKIIEKLEQDVASTANAMS